MIMNHLGTHFMVELYGCDTKTIGDVDAIEEIMVAAATMAKAKIIDKKFHTFSPHGVSGVVIIAESHLVIHTWPEHGYCAVDIFTCGDRIDNAAALNVFEKRLNSKHSSAMEIKRGLLNKSDNSKLS